MKMTIFISLIVGMFTVWNQYSPATQLKTSDTNTTKIIVNNPSQTTNTPTQTGSDPQSPRSITAQNGGIINSGNGGNGGHGGNSIYHAGGRGGNGGNGGVITSGGTELNQQKDKKSIPLHQP